MAVCFKLRLIAAVFVAFCAAWAPESRADETSEPTAPRPDEVSSVASSRVLLWYETEPGAARTDRIDLWSTTDWGRTWNRVEVPSVTGGPIAFDAPGDGLYGLFLVLHNSAGASSPPPSTSTRPQQWVRVDRTAPMVQILAVRPDVRFAQNREIHLRWAATDDDLPDRPVSIHFRTEQTKSYQLIADCLSPRSAYVWKVPEGASGRVELKVTATDRAGNAGMSVSDRLTISNNAPASRPADVIEGGLSKIGATENVAGAGRDNSVPPSGAALGSPGGESGLFQKIADSEPDSGMKTEKPGEARKKYEEGTYHRLRGEYELAAARFRDALAFDSNYLAPRCDLAGVLVLTGESEKAESELRSVLERDPSYRPALRGLAMVQTRRKNYPAARQTLDKLLLLEPRDAEAWIAFGDVMFFSGERAAARTAWSKADRLAGGDDDLHKRANRRLEMYP